jgi:hypothetical protein
MSTISYFTRSFKKGDKEISIWIRVHHHGLDIRQSLHLSVPARCWNKRKGWIKDRANSDSYLKERLEMTSTILNNLKHHIYTHFLDTDEPLFYPFVQFDSHMCSAQNGLCIGVMWLVRAIRLQRPHRMLPNSTPKGIHVASELHESHENQDNHECR